MEPFSRHVFVCTQNKPEGVTSCPASGSFAVLGALERELIAQGLDDEVQVTLCGCLGLCEEGPVLIVYPEGSWYGKVTPSDIPELVSSHLRSGKVVERLALTDPPAMKEHSKEHRDRFRSMMKAKEEQGILPEPLDEMIRAFMPSRAILTALELDVFTAIGNGATAMQVAGTTQSAVRAIEMLLDALVSLGLVEKREGQYCNTPQSGRFFVEGSRDSVRSAMLHTANLWHRWSTLTEAVQAGTAVMPRTPNPRSAEVFIAAMDRNSKERAGAVVNAVAPNGIRRMLDLGGGSGAYSIAFARTTPSLHCEILDISDVVPISRQYVKNAGLADRITVRAGDMLRDPLGENYDLVLLSAICHMFSPEENRDLLRRIHAALGPRGQLVLQDFILEPARTAPRAAALFSLNMLVGTRAGSSYSQPEYESWMKDAGFHNVRRVRMPGPAGLMIAERG